MKSVFMIPDLSIKDKQAARKAGLTSRYLYLHTGFWYNKYLYFRKKTASKLVDTNMIGLSDAICSHVISNMKGYNLFFYAVNRLLSKMGKPKLKFHKIVFVLERNLYAKIKKHGDVNILYLNKIFSVYKDPLYQAYNIANYLANKSARTGSILVAHKLLLELGVTYKIITNEYKEYKNNFDSIWFYKLDKNFVKECNSLECKCEIEPFAKSYKIKSNTKSDILNFIDRKDYNIYFDYLLSLTRENASSQEKNAKPRSLKEAQQILFNSLTAHTNEVQAREMLPQDLNSILRDVFRNRTNDGYIQ